MSIFTDIYYKELQATKERLINDIKFHVALEKQNDEDAFDGYEEVHLVRCFEGLPDEYITLTVRNYCEDYILAYTYYDYDLIKEFNGEKKPVWTPQDSPNLQFVGSYIIKIPYENIALEDLFHIADFVYNEDFWEQINNGSWKSVLKELPNID